MNSRRLVRIAAVSAVLTFVFAAVQSGHRTLAQAPLQPTPPADDPSSILQAIDPYQPLSTVEGEIRIFSSGSMDALAHGWADGFGRFQPQSKVQVYGAGADEATKQLIEDPMGIALFSRPVRESELAELKKHGLKNPVAIHVAREALAVFVNKDNPVHNISGEQLRAVFTTEQAQPEPTWQLFGATGEWATAPIKIVSRSENSGTQSYLREFVFNSTDLRPGISSHVSNRQVLEEVGKIPTAIAICGMRCEGDNVRMLQLMAGDTAVPSNDTAVLSGRYPLTRPLSLVIDLGQTGPRAQASQELVRYALRRSGQAQSIVVGFFPVDLPLLRAGIQQLDQAQP
ncbi:PstS family phosphate ABC transporter substrate-binding protein [Aureliella helgolandensis]|uniref:Phosphate-binding protein PstS 1 n=1 Tax=Aureliella helgolandensis TaxID=2527968 RepID=A0A518G6M0_9BACT|nr:substrate-binding domain-containing protein [Aureliella helgolandensis]QDV24232.1 Phosphate-binding protein PstS 1 precursor [Aureliella helgolandensis]